MPIYPQSEVPLSVMDMAPQPVNGFDVPLPEGKTLSYRRMNHLFGELLSVRITYWPECSARLNNSNP